MRLLPLVLAALLVALTGTVRAAVATGEAPPRAPSSPDLLVVLLRPLDDAQALEPGGVREHRSELSESSPLPSLLLVLEVDSKTDLSWIPETRVAAFWFSGGYPTGADPPESGIASGPIAHRYDNPRKAAVSQGLRRELPGPDELLSAQFRHASPRLGRWVKRDPGGFIDGPNRYRWNRNNPLRFVDFSGLAPDIWWDMPIGEPGGSGEAPGRLSQLDEVRNRVGGPWIPGFERPGWTWEDYEREVDAGEIEPPTQWPIRIALRRWAEGKGFFPPETETDQGDECQFARPLVHKNSLDYVGPTHVYAIEGPDGYWKIGESAQGRRVRDGASIRAESQVRKLRRETGRFYRSRILRTFDSKRAARDYETRLIHRVRRIYGRDRLPGDVGFR